MYNKTDIIKITEQENLYNQMNYHIDPRSSLPAYMQLYKSLVQDIISKFVLMEAAFLQSGPLQRRPA